MWPIYCTTSRRRPVKRAEPRYPQIWAKISVFDAADRRGFVYTIGLSADCFVTRFVGDPEFCGRDRVLSEALHRAETVVALCREKPDGEPPLP